MSHFDPLVSGLPRHDTSFLAEDEINEKDHLRPEVVEILRVFERPLPHYFAFGAAAIHELGQGQVVRQLIFMDGGVVDAQDKGGSDFNVSLKYILSLL